MNSKFFFFYMLQVIELKNERRDVELKKNIEWMNWIFFFYMLKLLK